MNIASLDVKLAYARAEWSKGRDSGELVFKCRRRPKLYDSCTWTRLMVPITDLFVKWKGGMGGRKWAVGSVKDIGEMMKEFRGDPFWEHAPFAIWGDKNNPPKAGKVWTKELDLPIIAIQDSHGHCNIDDGCHRAVIHYLAGAKLIDAFIGVPKS